MRALRCGPRRPMGPRSAAPRGACGPTRMGGAQAGGARVLGLILSLFLAIGVSSRAAGAEGADLVRQSVEALCPLDALSSFDAQIALPGSIAVEESVLPDRANPLRSVVRLSLPDGGELRLTRMAHNGVLRQFRVEYWALQDGALTPARQGIADGSCTLRSGRAIRHGEGAWRYLDQLEGDLTTLRWTETLQAPWPTGADPGGVRVALVDSGLAYDLPLFRDRLARDAAGRPMGYDFWDDDPWPYDGDTSRSAFLPIRHGTTVASIVAVEAPEAALVPYRYPRPDLSRMDDLVAHASAAGARILTMPLGSNRAEDWHAFAEALARHDILAIVSAGNNGRDIDARPVYPAALDAPNMITVTSADGFGRLAEGSNWGATSVDLMVPGENIGVTDFRGAAGVASGTSYAAPRVAALAARILAAEPELSLAELRARILARATPSPFERPGVVAVGWIADPLE